ncbi:BA75_04558T0 [Komagataella pastoris]|uniref:BA75_04558T0 n=1 Tax=Komagataella pastoris TaxID=4922 RepID=A0A1B2JIL0_PICPA|nr:BA75_04558T0 [Komagataella pastoris]
MSSFPSKHKAVVIAGTPGGSYPLYEVQEIPTITDLKDYQLLVQQRAFASNPTDWKHAALGWSKRGVVIGSDSAGVVLKVGPKVEGFSVGDHVSSFAHGGYIPHPTEGLFQEYAVVDSRWSINYGQTLKSRLEESRIPPSKVDSFENAATITLGLVTIGNSLHHHLGLREGNSDNSSKYILILGGATATGYLAIQVASKIYGLKVLATASSKNFEKLKAIGAEKVFDYHDDDVFTEIKQYAGENLIYAYQTTGEVDISKGALYALADHSQAYLNNIQIVTPENLAEAGVKVKRNVKLSVTLAYTTLGEDQIFPTHEFKVQPGEERSHREFWAYAPKYITNGDILAIEARVLGNGLELAEEASRLVKEGQLSAEKAVFRV